MLLQSLIARLVSTTQPCALRAFTHNNTLGTASGLRQNLITRRFTCRTAHNQNGADRGAGTRSVRVARERFSDEEQSHSGGSGRT